MNLLNKDINGDKLAKILISKYSENRKTILDVGAGDGYLLREITRTHHFNSFGIDPYITERNEENISLQSLSAEQITFLNRRFDLVYTVKSFHHFGIPDLFFREVEKSLSWEGKFIIVDWRNGAATGIHEKYYAVSEVKSMIEKTNLRIVEYGETSELFFIVGELKKRRIAVSTDDGGNIFPKMFGQAAYFDIYEFENGEFHFINRRENPYQKTLQHAKTIDVYKIVDDCQALLSARIGRTGVARLQDKGVRLIFDKGNILKSLNNLLIFNR